MIATIPWIEGLLTGQLATAFAVLAIAFVGFRTLLGQMPVRDAAKVILGCFIVFGAPAIARGLIGAVQDDVPEMSRPVPAIIAIPPAPAPPPTSANGNPFDPYAGNRSSD